MESMCVSVSDTLFLDDHDSSLCCGGWEHARSRQRDPVYHSPQEVGRKLPGRGLIASLALSFDVPDDRRECMATRTQPLMTETLLLPIDFVASIGSL